MPLPQKSARLTRVPTRDLVYDRLRELLITGALRPGDRLNYHELGQQLGVSFIPLREACLRLHHEGFVEMAHSRWTRVVALGPGGAADLCLAVEALDAAGRVTGSRAFYDMRPHMGADRPGLPDGMDVAASGHLFATGPGGVHVLTPRGKLLGVISTGKPIANCCLGENGRSLFMTSHDTLARVALRPPPRRGAERARGA